MEFSTPGLRYPPVRVTVSHVHQLVTLVIKPNPMQYRTIVYVLPYSHSPVPGLLKCNERMLQKASLQACLD